MSKLTILEPKSLTEAMEFSEVLSKSGMVPEHYRAKPANVLVAIQWGYELGLAPMQALQNISVINGRPSIWGDAMLALVKAHPMFRGVHEQLEGDTAVCEVKREMANGEIETTRATFSIAEAQKAGLTNKRGPWQSYPNRMLKLRARGFALRDAFPDAIKGLITTEEANDYPGAENRSSVKPVQRPDVSSEGDTIQNILDAVSEPESPGNEAPSVKQLVLSVPNRASRTFQSDEQWAHEYSELMLSMRQYEKLPHAERRTKLKELEQLNAETLDAIDEELATELRDKRKKFNAGLAVEEKEQADEGRTDAETEAGV